MYALEWLLLFTMGRAMFSSSTLRVDILLVYNFLPSEGFINIPSLNILCDSQPESLGPVETFYNESYFADIPVAVPRTVLKTDPVDNRIQQWYILSSFQCPPPK